MKENTQPLIHGNVYIDENGDIYIHELSLMLFIVYTYPNYTEFESDIANKIKELFYIESRYVTLNNEKYYHQKFIKKLLNLNNNLKK